MTENRDSYSASGVVRELWGYAADEWHSRTWYGKLWYPVWLFERMLFAAALGAFLLFAVLFFTDPIGALGEGVERATRRSLKALRPIRDRFPEAYHD